MGLLAFFVIDLSSIIHKLEMAISVETKHPVGLQEPKVIQSLANGVKQNGYIPNGKSQSELTNGHTTNTSKPHTTDEKLDADARAVLTLRNLIFDICNHNGGGHGGSALGMAAIGVALYKHVMRYNPADPSWFDRDRFVLSNGKNISLIRWLYSS